MHDCRRRVAEVEMYGALIFVTKKNDSDILNKMTRGVDQKGRYFWPSFWALEGARTISITVGIIVRLNLVGLYLLFVY